MANPKEAGKWLEKAKEDFEFSSSVLSETKYYAQVCFFFQQSAEKYLKAYIVENGLEFKKIHDLTVLLDICKEHDTSFGCLLEECRLLNVFYIDTRYPVYWPSEVSKKEAQNAQQAAKSIKELVESAIKG